MRFAEVARQHWRVAAVELGWRPEEFWSATPAELLSYLTLDASSAAMSHDALSQLLAQFPDQESGKDG